MTLALEWKPDAHPRWPKGTPHAGHIGAGEFMRVGDLIAKLSSQPSGSEDLTFLARGADRIERVIARRGQDPTHIDFDVHLNDGTNHTIGAGLTTDFSEVMGAMQHIDRGGPIGVQPGQDVLHRGTPGKVGAVDAATGIARVDTPEGKSRFVPRDQLTHAPNLKPPTGGPPKKPPGGGAGAAPSGATPGPRERLRTGLIVHTPNGRGTVTKSGSGHATVVHDKGGRGDFANSDLRVPGGTPGGAKADRQGRKPARSAPKIPRETPTAANIVQTRQGTVIATVHHQGGAVTKTSHPSIDEARRHLEAKHGLGASRVSVDRERAAAVRTQLGKGGYRDVMAGSDRLGSYKQLQNGRWRVKGDTADYASERAAQQAIKKAATATASSGPIGSRRVRVSKQTQAKHPEVQDILGGPWRDTQDKFSERVGGERVYNEARRKLHDRIVDMHLRERGADGELRSDTPYLKPQKLKEVLFTAGGPSAGKSNAVENSGLTPPASMIIDADGVEKMLPERTAILKAGQEGQYTGYAAHNEALDITHRIIDEAQKKGLNVTVDGNGDTNSGRFRRMLDDFQKRGYKMNMVMVDIPTDQAARNVDIRANGTKFKPGDGRYINIDRVRQVYRTARLNQKIWRDMPGANWQIYDNSAAIGEIIKAAEEGRKPDFAGKASRLVAAKKPNGEILYGRDALKDSGGQAAINASLGLAPKAAEKLYHEIVSGDR